MEAIKIYNQAQKLGVCRMLTGKESPRELMRLLLTPQGIEFCTKNQFPSLDVFRDYSCPMAERYGIYVDQTIELINPLKVVLVGPQTHATLTYDDPTQRHEVILMHGATAKIEAHAWAVVFVTGQGAQCTTTDNARILCRK